MDAVVFTVGVRVLLLLKDIQASCLGVQLLERHFLLHKGRAL